MMRLLKTGRWLALLVVVVALAVVSPAVGIADDPVPDTAGEGTNEALPVVLKSATFDQNLGDEVPLDLVFTDETGNTVTLGDYAGEKPILLTMNYYTCDSLCPLMLDAVARGLKPIPYTIGQDFELVTVSINPNEGPEDAAAVQQQMVAHYQRDGAAANWHMLTGDQATIDELAQAVGFNYTWDETTQQYAHPSGVIFLTGEGTIARYIYGVEFNPRDLRFALVETAERRIGTAVDQVLLFCYRYNPAVGSYSTIAFNTMRTGGALTILFMGAGLFWMLREERRASSKPATTQPSQSTA